MGEGWGMVEPLQPQRETQGERNHQLGKAAEKASPAALAKRGREPKRTGWRSARRTPKAFGKKAKRNKSAAQTAIGKMAEEARQAFGKKGRSIRNKRRKRTWEQERWKRRCKSREKMIKQWKWTKKKKSCSAFGKKARGKCTKQHCTKQQCCQTGTNSSCFCQWGRTWPRTQLGREEVKKKAARRKEAREQQKEPASYLEVVVKGGPLQKGQNQPKKKGKLDGRQQYVSLGTSSSSSSLAQPPTPPKPSRLRGTPAQPEREGLPERQPPTPPPKPLKKRLALDWHNCFQIREKGEDVVPNSHIRAYWDLQADGWEIFLLSFAGRERGEEVLQWAKSLPIKWAGMKIVTHRTGCWGKAEWALHFKCTHVLDDTPEILRESLEKGLKVVPISTYWERHQWAKKQGIQVYPDFVAAVADLVELWEECQQL